MKMRMAAGLIAGAGLVLGLAGAANATVYGFNLNPVAGGGPNYDYNGNGGAINNINATFDNVSKTLTFDVLFGPPQGAQGGSSLATNGFWLVINNGPNPKNHPGELAIFYFDASRVFNGTNGPAYLTAYGYNGANSSNSWQDGNNQVAGNQTPDLIKGKNESAGFVIGNLRASDTAGQRRLGFTINATDIMNRTPLYPVAGTNWYGAGFDQKLGIWFHPAQVYATTYDNGRGGLTSLNPGPEGWIDGQNFMTTIIPAPSSLALVGLGGLAIARRRRAN